MDPIATSNLNLNRRPSVALNESTVNNILRSSNSLHHEVAGSFKIIIPQIIAAVVVVLNHILLGASLAYSAILIPQLQDSHEIPVTNSELSWIASILTLSAPLGSIAAGYCMNILGRAITLKTAVIPAFFGWLSTALSYNVPTLIGSRIIVGFLATYTSGASIVYATEIARMDLRGTFLSLGPAFASIGMLLVYLFGSILSWRTTAYCATVYSFIPFIAMFFIPETPVWLISQGRIEEARKSLEWFNKYIKPGHVRKAIIEKQIQILLEERIQNIDSDKRGGLKKVLFDFLKPTGYKPAIILIGVFLFQQFSGAYIFLFYSVSFLRAAGTELDPYMSSVALAIVRLLMSLINVFIMKTCRRRYLLFISCIGMGTSILISGLFTHWIAQNDTNMTWVPVVCILLNVLCASFGLVSIPWTMAAEVFPIEIRSFASSLMIATANILMFFAIQSYSSMIEFFGDHAKLQWFFAGVSYLGAIYSIIIVPETHNKTLTEIEEYFRHNTIYISCGSKKRAKSRIIDDIRETRELI